MSNMKRNHHQKFRISYPPKEKKNLATGIKWIDLQNQLVLGKNSKDKVIPTLESGIYVTLRLLIFGIFSRGYGLIPDEKKLIFNYILVRTI